MDRWKDIPQTTQVVAVALIAALAYAATRSLTDVNTDVLHIVGLPAALGFATGLYTRSYRTILILPPCLVVTVLIPLLGVPAGFTDLLHGEYPMDRAIREGLRILFAFAVGVIPASYMLLTPPIAAGVWLGDRLRQGTSR